MIDYKRSFMNTSHFDTWPSNAQPHCEEVNVSRNIAIKAVKIGEAILAAVWTPLFSPNPEDEELLSDDDCFDSLLRVAHYVCMLMKLVQTVTFHRFYNFQIFISFVVSIVTVINYCMLREWCLLYIWEYERVVAYILIFLYHTSKPCI